MTTDNLINLVVAILVGGGTLALAFMTWKSIRQTRSIQKREHRHRLLSEIIAWATNVAKCALQTGVFDETMPVSGLGAERALTELLDRVVDFRMVRVDSVYISNITSEIAPELKTSVDDLTEEIKNQIKLTMEYKRERQPIYPPDEAVTQIARNSERLYNLATKLIDDAANILKRDLSVKQYLSQPPF